MCITINIIFNFFYILFYIDISYQLSTNLYLPPAPYLSIEMNPTWGILIRRSYLLSLVT